MLFMLYLYASEFSFIAMLVSILDVAYCKNVTTGRFHCFDDEQVKDVATNSIRVCTYVCTAVFSVTWLCHMSYLHVATHCPMPPQKIHA